MLQCLWDWQALGMLLVAGDVVQISKERALRVLSLQDWDAVEGFE